MRQELQHYSLFSSSVCWNVWILATSLALNILQKRLSALKIGKEKVHKLSYELLSLKGLGLGFIDYDAVHELRKKLLLELEEVLPSPITLPEGRLEHLVEIGYVLRMIAGNCDEVRFETLMGISDGSKVFQNNKIVLELDYVIRILDILVAITVTCGSTKYVQDDNRVTIKHVLLSHKNPVSFVAWSPDDTMLLSCGNMEVLKLWDVETGTCKHTFINDGFTVSSCAWFPDSKRLVCGSSDPKKGIYMWDCEGKEIKAWKGMRMPKVLDLAVTPDGENLISIFSDKEIRILNLTTNAERVISEEHSITSLSVSGDSNFLIVNLNSQEIHMWDIAGKWLKPLKYNGHKQQKYVIRSCFGGLNSMFIASGSEDSKVYIWNRRSSNPIEILSGHLMTIKIPEAEDEKGHARVIYLVALYMALPELLIVIVNVIPLVTTNRKNGSANRRREEERVGQSNSGGSDFAIGAVHLKSPSPHAPVISLPCSTNEASKKPSGKDFHDKEYRDGLGAVASSNFIIRCTYGKRTAEVVAILHFSFRNVNGKPYFAIAACMMYITMCASPKKGMCVPHLNTVVQLLSNMQSCQLKSLSRAQLTQEQESEPSDQNSRVA
ncbi:WD repeat-containing protein WDS [Sesamum angolense]|uniref:WD repeat-containing protein WDS n=1 Tax=Sesamum angolense TaxID=2727404 RepID=A0AAE2C412_9LAMI|nr:WD repeat-containing protein WDS [Sesamum angolense]